CSMRTPLVRLHTGEEEDMKSCDWSGGMQADQQADKQGSTEEAAETPLSWWGRCASHKPLGSGL
ncbi:hypothetical protein NHX12_011522, partial [Muraenolepis orangiensis]